MEAVYHFELEFEAICLFYLRAEAIFSSELNMEIICSNGVPYCTGPHLTKHFPSFLALGACLFTVCTYVLQLSPEHGRTSVH